MDRYEKQIAEILPLCKKCGVVLVAIEKIVNKSILCGCKCGWGGLGPKDWKREHDTELKKAKDDAEYWKNGRGWTQRKLNQSKKG